MRRLLACGLLALLIAPAGARATAVVRVTTGDAPKSFSRSAYASFWTPTAASLPKTPRK